MAEPSAPDAMEGWRASGTPAKFAAWLATHDAKVRAAGFDQGYEAGKRDYAASVRVVAEEPEWEFGACYQGDNGRELLWFSMGNSGFAIREAAEKEVERYADAQIQLCRRRKAGPWVPVKQGDETDG